MAKESSPKQKLTNAQRAYLARIKNLVSSSSSFQSLLLQVRQQGKNYVRQTERLESKQFDSKFVDELEKGFDAIEHVIANPRTFIKDEPELVEAGLAKKINSQSITHLASHTQFVHSVDEKGNVTPEKILTIHAEIDVQIYENRFVMTLIKKCSLFIEKRFNFIKDHGETLDSDLLLIKSTSNIDGAKYEVDSRIKVSSPSKDDGNKEKNEEILKRLATLRERCAYFMHSPFMAQMAGAKDVANPIHMTNMIVKNPYYHGAYELWKFIDQYTDLGVSYNVKETEQEFSQPYFEEIFALVMADILTLRSNLVKNRKLDTSKVKDKVINPKVLFTLEDETYYDGKFLYDQFPGAKRKRTNPMALTPEEAKEQRLAIEENLREERYKKTLIDENIEEQKNKDIAKEAIERQKKAEAEEKARLKAEKAAQKELEKQRALEEKKRKEEEKKALLQEQKELEKARRAIRRKARDDRKAKEETIEDKPLEDVLPIQEEQPIVQEPILEEPTPVIKEAVVSETPVEEAPNEAPVEEPVKEDEPVVEETPVIAEPAEENQVEEAPAEEIPQEPVEETPVVEESVKEEAPIEEIPVIEEQPIEEPQEEQPIEEPTPLEEPQEQAVAEETPTVIEPIEETPAEETPIEEPNIEKTPIEPQPNEEKPKRKRSPRKKKEEPSEDQPVEDKPKKKRAPRKKKEETPTEEIKEKKPRKPRKKKEPLPVVEPEPTPIVEEPIKEEPAPIVEEPLVQETPVVEEATPVVEEPVSETPAEETSKENAPKEKYVRNVPTFRAEKDYVFIKTRKSNKAKKVVLKGKLKV